MTSMPAKVTPYVINMNFDIQQNDTETELQPENVYGMNFIPGMLIYKIICLTLLTEYLHLADHRLTV